MRTLISSVVLAAACAVACSSSSTDDGNQGGNGACTVTLSGAITATLSCTTFSSYGQEIVGQSVVSILTTGTPGFDLGVSVAGQLATGTITESSASVQQAVTTASNNGLLWSQDIRDPAHGAVTVHLTTATLGSDGHTITIHGTADATLTPSQSSPGATGTVTAHATF